jgi:hypothetical protein
MLALNRSLLNREYILMNVLKALKTYPDNITCEKCSFILIWLLLLLSLGERPFLVTTLSLPEK